MSLARFFLPSQVLACEQESPFILRLSAEDEHHARVLRLAAGEHVAVVDAAQDYFECEIVSFDAAGMCVRIAAHNSASVDRPQVCLLQGISKGDKVDVVIRHATELGVTQFVPLACERSVVKLDGDKAHKRVGRWRAIAKSAAMQSGQPRIPEVTLPYRCDEVAEILSDATCILICWEEAHGVGVSEAIAQALQLSGQTAAHACVALVIGPEGGLTQHEVDYFLHMGPPAYAVTLGPSILRTETAGIVAPALALSTLGVLQ